MSDDDDDDLEIIETSIATINSNVADADDLRFQLRNKESRLKLMFPHMKSMFDLDFMELSTAKSIFQREENEKEQMRAESQRTIGQKRKESQIEKIPNMVPLSSGPPRQEHALRELKQMPSTVSSANPEKKSRNSLLSDSGLNRNSLLGNRPSGSTLSSSSQQRWNGVENMRLVGSNLVNMETIMKNAPKSVDQRSNQASDATRSGDLDRKKKEDKLLSEIDQLLSQKSAHDSEANDAWHENFQNRLKNLEKQEFKDQKKQQLQFIVISAFECVECNGFITELYPSLCKDKNHVIHQIKAIKRFFVCRNCGRRDSTLTNQQKATTTSGVKTKDQMKDKDQAQPRLFLPPNRSCYCGKDDWVLPTAANSAGREGVHSLTGEKLVASATDWTSRQDRLNMASRVSSLDRKY